MTQSRGYVRMCLDDWPDFEAIKDVEIAVAAGIVRWIAQHGDSAFVTEMMRQANARSDPEAWQAVVWLLWQSMKAWEWIKPWDCISPKELLWQEAMRRAYYKLVDGTFEYPTERNESEGQNGEASR